MSYRAVETQVDAKLRKAVTDHLSSMFPLARVSVQRAVIVDKDHISIHNIKIYVRDGNKAREVMAIERVDLRGDLDIAHFVQETVRVRQVDIYRPHLKLWQTQSGAWSFVGLTCKQSKKSAPRINIQNGEMRVYRAIDANATPIVVHDISGEVFEGGLIAGQDSSLAMPPIGDPQRLLECKLSGRRSSGCCEAIVIHGWFNKVTGACRADGAIQELSFSTNLARKLPENIEKSISQLAGLTCKVHANFLSSAKGTTVRPS